jgi:hypothetical protein
MAVFLKSNHYLAAERAKNANKIAIRGRRGLYGRECVR